MIGAVLVLVLVAGVTLPGILYVELLHRRGELPNLDGHQADENTTNTRTQEATND